MEETSRIVALANQISSTVSSLDKEIRDTGHSFPSFTPTAPLELLPNASPDFQKTKDQAIEALIELRQLLEGPIKLLLPESNFFPLASVYRYNIASHVPENDHISFSDLASKCNLAERDLQRIVRYTTVHHRVFSEPEKGFVSHTAASKLICQESPIRDIMGLTFEECYPAHAKTVDAISKRSEEPNHTGYALANETELDTFEFWERNPERAKRFAGAMSGTSTASLDALAHLFSWEELSTNKPLVVDIGGSKGHVSMHLARRFPHLSFVVQDKASVLEGTRAPYELQDQIEFMVHDMFTKQPVKGADVYLLRYVLHDWPNKYCVNVIQNLIPCLKRGAKIVIQDFLLPEPGTLSLLQEMQVRSMDAIMLTLFNSQEREEEDWRRLFNEAHEGFSFTATRVPDNPSTAIIVAEWMLES
ncbi:S-adenosyl-L-methionine-dependent methyltransferase [Delitschia confertaspora ATCC 74209]|uniref:S-adenosyl-L-methionine-dependent methyltransferase n=1 Tax=Delitschia confertaspora ATCC 74209 TaxID=1513339 RepID=A0A9P4JN49_9PLEO|nr:S-adenosyl-L-methionine-dependent methyltransferase [Delitschia confertaspora ATCC 74209]